MRFLIVPSDVRLTALAAAAGACLCLAPGAGAQTMAQPGKTAQPGHAAQPGQAVQPPLSTQAVPPPVSSTDDPAKVAAAREFILLYHPQAAPGDVAKRIDQVMPRMVAAAKAENPKLDVKKFEQERKAAILAQANKMLDLQAHVVSRHFTLPELKQLTAFFGGPLGRKLAEETPKIQRDIMLSRPLNGGPPGRPPAAMQMKIGPQPANPPAHK